MIPTRWCLVVVLALSFPAVGQSTEETLAQRFRPYLKFTKGEDHRPCNWQFFFRASELEAGGKTVSLASSFDPILAASDVRTPKGKDAVIKLIDSKGEASHGESWEAAEKGNGLYARVTVIGPSRYNIEYWVLFAYNDSVNKHEADLIGIQLVYHELTDSLIRATYSIHGKARFAFDLALMTWKPVTLGAARARRGTPLPNAAHVDEGWVYGVDVELDLVEDAATGRFEHPAIYIERGGHEPWPIPGGKFHFTDLVPHDGNDRSFLPERAQLFRTPEDDPFVFYAGALGKQKDSVAIQRHRMWRNPEPTVEKLGRSDKDPYVQMGKLTWPPEVPAEKPLWWVPFDAKPHVCPGGMVARGLACKGSYCSDVSLGCAAPPPYSGKPEVVLGSPVALETFSEEKPNRRACPDGAALVGLECSGKNCDNLTASCAPARRTQLYCETKSVSEEDRAQLCGNGKVIRSLTCKGRYCDRIDFECCNLEP